VFVEGAFHYRAEFLVDRDQVDFAVVQKAAHVEVGGADRGPVAVDNGGLGVQYRCLQLEDAHAGRQQFRVVGTPRMHDEAGVGYRREDDLDLHAAPGGISQRFDQLLIRDEIGVGDVD